MIPKSIIEKAVEGGWKPRDNAKLEKQRNLAVIALDAAFWQALGTALGWREKVSSGLDFEGRTLVMEQWRNEALHFYDLVLTNQPTDKFWQELLAGNDTQEKV